MDKRVTENHKGRSYAFEGLGEKQLRTLFSLANTKTLQKNETLFLEGDTDPALYVVLEGEIRVVKHVHGQKIEMVSTLRAGSWVGETGFIGGIPRTASAFANKPTKVLTIDRPTLSALDEETQLFLYKRLNVLTSMIIGDLDAREKKLTRRNRQLTESLFSARRGKNKDYPYP
jgi:CRP-like cAMP-binding protein